MKKAAFILFIIGSVVSFLLACSFVAIGVLFIVFSGPQFTGQIVAAIRDGAIRSSLPGTPEQQAQLIQLVFLIMGIFFLPIAGIAVTSGIFAIIATKKETTTIYVLNIVFGILCGSFFNLVGGIIGIVSQETQNKKEIL